MIGNIIALSIVILGAYYMGKSEERSRQYNKIQYRRRILREKRDGIYWDGSGTVTITTKIQRYEP